MIPEHAKLVDRLIAKVAESIDEYIWAAENSDNPATSARFLNCANQRVHGLKHLKAALERLNGDPDDTASSGGSDVTMNTVFRNALSSGDGQRREAEIRREQDELLSAYHAILKLDLDEKVEHEIRQSLEIIKQSSIQVPADD